MRHGAVTVLGCMVDDTPSALEFSVFKQDSSSECAGCQALPHKALMAAPHSSLGSSSSWVECDDGRLRAAACTPQDKVIRTHHAAAYVSQQQQKNNMPHDQ